MSLKIKEEKFKVIQFIRELIIYIDKSLENFPKKDIELKNRLRNNSYDLLELAYLANTTKNIDKKIGKLEEIISKIKVIDFLCKCQVKNVLFFQFQKCTKIPVLNIYLEGEIPSKILEKIFFSIILF